jgi:hypothetical protein
MLCRAKFPIYSEIHTKYINHTVSRMQNFYCQNWGYTLLNHMNTRKEMLLTIGYTNNIESKILINGNMLVSHVKAVILPLPALLARPLLGHDL